LRAFPKAIESHSLSYEIERNRSIKNSGKYLSVFGCCYRKRMDGITAKEIAASNRSS
jgi:hypothetical protein